MGITFRGTF